MTDKNIIVFYHSNCNDGRGAALAAWIKFGDSAEYWPTSYHNDPPVYAGLKGKDVYILDFSYELDVMRNIISVANKVVLLDHHKTAEKALSVLVDENIDNYESLYIMFNMRKSGCMLAWDYFFPSDEAPKLFSYLQDYDLWIHKYKKSKYVSQALYAEGYDPDRWEVYLHDSNLLDMLVEKGRILYDHEMNMCEVLLKHSWTIQVLEGTELETKLEVVNAPMRLASKLGEVHIKNGIDYPIMVYQEFEEECGISFRRGTNSEIDLSRIAEELALINNCRGGGHPGASGLSPKTHYYDIRWSYVLTLSETTQRYEDMSPTGKLIIHRQQDGDIIVAISDINTATDEPINASVEFCTSGGHSFNTLMALRQVMRAMEKDDIEHNQDHKK